MHKEGPEPPLAHYAAIEQQLGANFLTELENTITRIVSMPEAWTQLVAGTRRCLLHRFPYGVIYETEFAYWLDRIPTK